MNVLLFAPALLAVLLYRGGVKGATGHVLLCGLIQLVLGWPFLSEFPREYIMGSFNLGRVFDYKWTVNFKFLPQHVFVSKGLAVTLLALHIVLLLFFLKKLHAFKVPVTKSKPKEIGPVTRSKAKQERSDEKESKGMKDWEEGPSSLYIVLLFFVVNFIGIVCARSVVLSLYVCV